jgi:hypothetical protein
MWWAALRPCPALTNGDGNVAVGHFAGKISAIALIASAVRLEGGCPRPSRVCRPATGPPRGSRGFAWTHSPAAPSSRPVNGSVKPKLV